MDCVAGLFSGLWCIAVIQEQASPIYLRQHKSAQTFHSQRSRIHRPSNIFTYSHSLQQLRARKGGARGGKAGFATLSAFPLVPAHAKMVPLKGKVPASHASPGKGITCVSSIPPGKGITCVSSIPPERASPAFHASSRKGKTSSGRRSGFGFIVELRDRSYRGIRIHRRFIKLSGNIPIENCHTGFYIRHQPDQCQIQCKYGKNDPRNKT